MKVIAAFMSYSIRQNVYVVDTTDGIHKLLLYCFECICMKYEVLLVDAFIDSFID